MTSVDKTKDEKKTSSQETIETAKNRYKLADEAYSEVFAEARTDRRFRVGDQWPDDVKKERQEDGRPCLVTNRTPQFIRQITNDIRQNRPSIKINPVDDKADPETAKVLQGLIRHIEYDSGSDVAYDNAADGAVGNSFGYFRLITEYEDHRSMKQKITIKQIEDPMTVRIDPYHQEPDGSDANWAFLGNHIPKDDYNAEYGSSELAQMEDWGSLDTSGWITKDSVLVLEYYYKTFKEKDLIQLSDGKTYLEDELPEQMPAGTTVLGTRKTKVPTIKWCKINGIEVLDEKDLPDGRYIPIVQVLGEKIIVDGKKILESVHRHARDPQRMYNYFVSAEAEAVGLAPKAPFMVADGQITKAHEPSWKVANKKNIPYLTYVPKSIDGTLVPPPSRNAFEAPIQAITTARMQASEDMKATTGIYDASLGNRGAETSGVAIQRRNQQSQTSNFHYVDNITRAIRYAGKICIAWIPVIYDVPQVVRTLGEDGEPEMVAINQLFSDPKTGQQKIHDFSVGKYDVTVDTGPNYATKRQEAVASMLDLSRTAPQLMASAGDIMVKNMDWPDSSEIAERIRKTMPPGIVDDPKGQQPLPPQAQQQMQQQGQMIQQLTQQLNQATELLKSKSLDLQSKERIAYTQQQTSLTVQQMKNEADLAGHAFGVEMAHLQNSLNQVGDPSQLQTFTGASAQMPPGAQPQQPTGGPSPGNSMGVNP